MILCRRPAHQRAPESDLGAVTKRLRGRDHFSTRAGPVAIDAGQRAQGKPFPPYLLNVNLARSRADASAARAAVLAVIADAEIGGDFAGDGRWARQVTWA